MQTDLTAGASRQRSARAPAFSDPTSTPQATQRRSLSRAECGKVLRRAGYSATQAESVLRGLPDQIDLDRDGEGLFKKGVSLDRLTDAMGGSP